jgi:hypothetical protein
MKKYLFGLFAIALAIGFSAFTNHKASKTQYWYRFNVDHYEAVVGGTSPTTPPSSITSSQLNCDLDIDICEGVFDDFQATLITSGPDAGKYLFSPAGSKLFDTFQNEAH